MYMCNYYYTSSTHSASTCGLTDLYRHRDQKYWTELLGMSTVAVSSDGSPIFDVVQSWGVASARHTSGCLVYPPPSPIDLTDDGGKKKVLTISSSPPPPPQDSCVDTEYLFDVPIGPSIVRWNFQTRRCVLQFQAHCDVVTSMRMSPDQSYIATSCFSGEVKLWSLQWACLDHVTAPMSSQHHVGECKDLICLPSPPTHVHTKIQYWLLIFVAGVVT